MEIEELKEKYAKSNPKASMGFVEKIKKVILSPSEFFDAIKAEEGISQAFIYYAVLSLIFDILFGLSYIFIPVALTPSMPFKRLGVMWIIISYIAGLIFVFINAGITHIFTKILGGKGDYSATFKSLVYASTPTLLLGWIPLIGVIFSIYTLYLTIKGISSLHSITMLRAFIAVLVIPSIIAIILGILFGAFVSSLATISLPGPTGSFLQILRPFV